MRTTIIALLTIMITACGGATHTELQPQQVLNQYYMSAIVTGDQSAANTYLSQALIEEIGSRTIATYRDFDFEPKQTTINHESGQAQVKYKLTATAASGNQRAALKTATLKYEGGRWLIYKL